MVEIHLFRSDLANPILKKYFSFIPLILLSNHLWEGFISKLLVISFIYECSSYFLRLNSGNLTKKVIKYYYFIRIAYFPQR